MSGVCSAGLSTQVLPHASAGASFHAAINSGKFHGMICPHTPTGSRSVKLKNAGSLGLVSPVILLTQPA